MDWRESPIHDQSNDCAKGNPSLVIRAIWIALYLRGSAAPNLAYRRQSWPRLRTFLRRGCYECTHPADAIPDLRGAGFWQEAAILDSPVLIDWALGVAGAKPPHLRALTVLDPSYPANWIERLDAAAPPCLWMTGEDLPGGKFVGVVGSRNPDPFGTQSAERLGATIARAGMALVSGGAIGVDQIGARGCRDAGGQVVEVLPYGLSPCGRAGAGSTSLSVSPPGTPFSTPSAMERNLLIYATGPTVVIQPRFGKGGTWVGACEAIRRRVNPVAIVVPSDGHGGSGQPGEPDPIDALIKLGAWGMHLPVEGASECYGDALQQFLDAPYRPAQPTLFGLQEVREPTGSYA